MFRVNSHRQKVIKLNTNENPYPPAPGVLAAMKKLEGHVDRFKAVSGSDI